MKSTISVLANIAGQPPARTSAGDALNAMARTGPNVAGHDPVTDALVALFNPRVDRWGDHVAWSGARLDGRTPCGRATVDVLRINDPNRVAGDVDEGRGLLRANLTAVARSD